MILNSRQYLANECGVNGLFYCQGSLLAATHFRETFVRRDFCSSNGWTASSTKHLIIDSRLLDLQLKGTKYINGITEYIKHKNFSVQLILKIKYYI